MKKTILALMYAAAATLTLPSCSTNYFNEERYEMLIEDVFPVSDIDKNHTWNLMQTVAVIADLNASPAGEYAVDIYDGDPKSNKTRKLATGAVTGSKVFKFSMPRDINPSTLYAVAYQGNTVVVDGMFPFVNSTLTIKSKAGDEKEVSAVQTAMSHEFTYCFEETYPEGGDFDFNDVVMGVSLRKSPKSVNDSAYIVDVNIRLRAVGATRGLAASMHINGVTPDDVAPYFTMPVKGWNYYKYADTYLTDPKGKVETTHYGDVRVDLFNDAHYAISGGLLDQTGTQVPRVFFNTKTDTLGLDWLEVPPTISTYRLKFNDVEKFNALTVEDLDIFIISSYNGNFFEIHTPGYIKERSIYDYPVNNINVPWALVIPDVFRYPYEGVEIGRYSSDLSYYEGAYQRAQYSFGAWARNRNDKTAEKWYHYPTESRVYPEN